MKNDEYEYLLIDGNWARKPCAYCKTKKGYLTRGIANTHRCIERKCMHYVSLRKRKKEEGVNDG